MSDSPMAPLFSIITVTYNAESTLQPTIDSIDSQTCTLFEHIVMDGCSTDGTLELLRRNGGGCGGRRRVYSSPDKGLYDAMNKGLDEARGDYVIFLNAGDRFHAPDTLQLMADAIIDHDYPGIVYGRTDLVDATGRKIADRHLQAPEHLTLASFSQGMVVCHQAMAVLRRITGMYDLRYRFSADYEWVIRCLQHSRRNVYVDAVVADYLSEGLTTANRRRSLMERFRIMSHYYGLLPTLARHVGFVPRFVSNALKMRRAARRCQQK